MLDVNHRHPDVAGPVRTSLWCYGLRATAGLGARYATLMPMAGFYMLRIGPRAHDCPGGSQCHWHL